MKNEIIESKCTVSKTGSEISNKMTNRDEDGQQQYKIIKCKNKISKSSQKTVNKLQFF